MMPQATEQLQGPRKKRGKPTGSHSWVTALAGPGSISNRPEDVTRWLLLQKCLIRCRVFAILPFHCFLSWQLCIIGNAVKSKWGGRKLEPEVSSWSTAALGGGSARQVQLPSPPAPLTHHWKLAPLCLLGNFSRVSCLLYAGAVAWPTVAVFRGLLCSLFNEQNPWKGADILMPPIDALYWDVAELCTAFKALANPNASWVLATSRHMGCNLNRRGTRALTRCPPTEDSSLWLN